MTQTIAVEDCCISKIISTILFLESYEERETTASDHLVVDRSYGIDSIAAIVAYNL